MLLGCIRIGLPSGLNKARTPEAEATTHEVKAETEAWTHEAEAWTHDAMLRPTFFTSRLRPNLKAEAKFRGLTSLRVT